jgi:hypothetical protein
MWLTDDLAVWATSDRRCSERIQTCLNATYSWLHRRAAWPLADLYGDAIAKADAL